MRVNKCALNSWLRTKIESLSISDPAPITRYILVLVSKEKPERELKAFCIEQLEELLGSNTADFVEEMFTVALTSSSNDGDPSPTSKDKDERPYRRGKSSPLSRSPSSPSEKPKARHRSPVGRKSRSPLDSTCEPNLNRCRRPFHPSSNDSKRQSHEYGPGDFGSRFNSHRRRSRSPDNEKDPDTGGRRERSSQRLERQQAHYDRAPRGRPLGSLCNKTQEEPRRRCRNFDERGFCNFGDQCKYDHGGVALVVMGNSAASWTSNLIDPQLAAPVGCLIPLTSPKSSNGVLDVSPESKDPSMETENMDSGGLPIYNPTPIVEPVNRKLPQSFRPRTVNKNIIPIPMSNNYEPASLPRQRHSPSATTPPAYEPARPDPDDEGANLLVDSTEYTPSPIFQQSQKIRKQQQEQSSLLVTKLPYRLNNVQQLHDHFSRFGSLVDIQTQFEGQNSQALVTYLSAAEALSAYRSPEPILSNRFIRLFPWPNAQAFSGLGRGNRFPRHAGASNNTLGFSQHGQSLLGDAQLALDNNSGRRLSAKFRLGDNSLPGDGGNSNRFIKRSLQVAAGGGVLATTKKPPNRSRWRLERDQDGNPLSEGDDDEEEEDTDSVVEAEQHGEETSGDRKRMRRFSSSAIDAEAEDLDVFSFIRNNTWISGGFDGSAEAAATLARKRTLWERQKATALKEHQAKKTLLEKQKAVRKQAETARKTQQAQLSAELKETIAALEAATESDQKPGLMAKVKLLYRQLNEIRKQDQAAAAGLGAGGKRSLISAVTEDAKQQATVQQVLPDEVATERLEKIAETKKEVADLETQAQQISDTTSETRVELRRKIADLKRRLVNLETIRPSDLAAMNPGANLPGRGQTKIDKRPRALYVNGLTSYDVDDFRQALVLNYFYTESFCPLILEETGQPVVEITFCTRDFAEAAMRTFPKFHGRPLEMSFTRPTGRLLSSASLPSAPHKSPASTNRQPAEQQQPPSAPSNADVSLDEFSIPHMGASVVEDESETPAKVFINPQSGVSTAAL